MNAQPQYIPRSQREQAEQILRLYARGELSLTTSAVAYLYYDLGWTPVPAIAKNPLIPWRRAVIPARPTREVMVRWWQRNPHANITLLTGERSLLVVADVDPRHGGDVATLYARGWPEDTPTVISGSGGIHVYCAYPDDGEGVRSVPHYAPGIEIKADGAVIVPPPSIHPVTQQAYRWMPGRAVWDTSLKPLPPAALTDVRAQRPARPASEPVILSEAELRTLARKASRFVRRAVERACANVDGGRHNTGLWLACQLRDLRVTDVVGRQCLLAYQHELEARHV